MGRPSQKWSGRRRIQFVAVLGSVHADPHDAAPLSTEQITAIVQNCVSALEFALAKGKEVALWKENKTAAKALVCLEVARRVLPWVNFFFLVFVAGNGLFVVPFAMEKKKDVIEQKLQPLIAKAIQKKDELKAKVPHFVEKADYMK